MKVEMAEQDFINEKKAAAREFEEHKDYLREQVGVWLYRTMWVEAVKPSGPKLLNHVD